MGLHSWGLFWEAYPLGIPAMANEVLGSDKSLLEAIADDDVPKPAPMFWDAWQIWRKGPGKRPTRDKCLRANVPVVMRSAKEESQLWGATMGALYGANWKERLAGTSMSPPWGRDFPSLLKKSL